MAEGKKVILVTGGNAGIGLAVCKELLEKYHDTFVYMGSRDLERGNTAAAQFKGFEDRIKVLKLDVTQESDVESARQKILEDCGTLQPLYALVNNAGIMSPLDFEVSKRDKIKACVDVNTYGMKRMCDAFANHIQRAPQVGRIVNVTSMGGPYYVEEKFLQRQFAGTKRDAKRNPFNFFLLILKFLSF
jgi:carbonyl reductase 1